ncbi:MAG: nucleotidyltransferase family protein, partial [candidate division Zixibacteria bacterium]
MTDLTAVVLAGGQGSRLKPITENLPKPLVPVGDRPIIELLLKQLRRGGVTEVCIAVNHLAHLIEAAVGDGSDLNLKISYSHEENSLSTVGPLKLIKNLPEHFIVSNGDILTDIDVGKLFNHHLAEGNRLTVATAKRRAKLDYGVLSLDDDGRLVGFSEKP